MRSQAMTIDWSKRRTKADREAERQEREQRQQERQDLRNYRPGRGQLQKRIEYLEAIVQQLIKATL